MKWYFGFLSHKQQESRNTDYVQIYDFWNSGQYAVQPPWRVQRLLLVQLLKNSLIQWDFLENCSTATVVGLYWSFTWKGSSVDRSDINLFWKDLQTSMSWPRRTECFAVCFYCLCILTWWKPHWIWFVFTKSTSLHQLARHYEITAHWP